jgi:hypothetical protein
MLISLNPASATSGGSAFTLTLVGMNFTPVSTANWGSTVLATTYTSATELSAVVPASLIAGVGAASITVCTAGETSSGAVFTIDPSSPVIASLNPASAAAGRAFTSSTNNANIASTSTWSATPLTAAVQSTSQMVPPVFSSQVATSNSASLEVTPPANPSSPATTVPAATNQSAAQLTATVHANLVKTLSGNSPGATLDVSPPSPTIAGMSPTSATVGNATFTLTINGANFLPGALASVVTFGTTPLVTTYVSSTQLTAVVPASLISVPGSYTVLVSVVTAGGVSPGVLFTVNQAQPVIYELDPAQVPAGSGAFVLTISGNYFTSTPSVTWGNTPLAITGEWNVLYATVPASLVANPGTVNVTVTTYAGTSAPVVFTITQSRPTITGMSPASAAAGGATFTLNINGTNFSSPSNVLWGSTSLSTTYVSATQLTAVVPASLIATAGMTSVTVADSGGTSLMTTFTIHPAQPTITSLTPSSVTAGGAGFMLTINGAAFTPNTATTWGTTALGTIYLSPTQLIVAVPASLIQFSGTGNVTVTTEAGTSLPSTFTINPAPPAICSLSPGLATAGGSAFTLTISGEYFTSAATAKWGSIALTTTYISQTQLTAVVPANLIASAGASSVSVTTPAGISASIPVTINPAINITTTTLPAGTAGNSYSGTINVTGGSPGYTWTVTGLPSSMSFPNTSDSTLTITGTPASSGAITFQVSVEDTVGASAGPVTYTINFAAGPSGANNGNLDGSYVCLLQGSVDTDGTRWATLASFQADGQGNFTSGIFDTNSYDIGSGSGTMTGSYNIGADNNGMASIHTILTEGAAGIQTTNWAIALSSAAHPAQQFRMIEADDLGTLPSYQQGTANCYLATASAFASSTISGNSFAFGLDGEDNNGNMKAAAGLFSASGGKITNGNIDMAQGGSATVQTDAFTATYTAPDPASGRFTIALNGAGNSTGFTVYIIDVNRMFILDNTNDDGEQAGNMRTQQQATTSGASIAGPFVLYMRGAEFNNRGNVPSGYYADVFQGTGDGEGNISINQSYKNDAGVYLAGNGNGGPTSLAFDPIHPGKATFQSASGTTYLYLFNNNSAFEMGVGDNGSVESGWLEAQTQTNFTNAALAGNYLFGNLSLLNIEPTSSVGVLGVIGSGVINAALTITSRGILSWDQSTSMTYSWDATAPGTGTFLIASGAQGEGSCAVISATKFVCTSQTDPAPSVEVIEQ